MKQIYFLAIILFGTLTNINAQTSDVVTNIEIPNGLAFHGNNLYISVRGFSKISKIDITAFPYTLTDVVYGLTDVRGLVFSGNDLYIAESKKISKIDITATMPVLTDVLTGLNYPIGLAIKGNDLYIAEFYQNKISKIDITATTPILTDVITGLNGPTRLLFVGDNLYISEFLGNKISKINVTKSTPTLTEVLTGLNGPSGLCFNGNDLYFSEFNDNKISKIDITATIPKVTTVAKHTMQPVSLIHNGDDLYIAERGANKISKLDYHLYYLSGGFIILILTLLFLLIRYLKKHKRKNTTSELKIKEQHSKLKSQEKISSLLQAKEKILAEIKYELKDISKTNDSNLHRQKAKKLYIKVNHETVQTKHAGSYEELYQINALFFEKISTSHPKLIQSELILCYYIFIKLKNTEIAPILNSTLRAVESKRYRIRTKMEIKNKNISLLEAINNSVI